MALIDLQFEGDEEETQEAAAAPQPQIELEFEDQGEGREPLAPGVTGYAEPLPYSNLERMTERLGQRWAKSKAGLKAMAAAQEIPTTREQLDEGIKPPTDGGVKDWLMYSPHGEILNKAASMVTKGIVDVADMVYRGDLREDLQESNRIIREEANATLGSRDMQYEGNAGVKFGWDVAEATVNMAPAIAIGWATRNPGLALGVIGGEVGGTAYTDYLEKTGSHDRAMAAAKFNVAAEVIPETIPVLAILRKTKAGEGLTRFLEATIGEGAQEMLTSVLQQTYDAHELEEMSLKDAILNIDWSDAAYEGAIGLFVGGILSSPGTAADYYASKKQGAGPPPEPTPDPLVPDFEVKSLEENATAIDDALEAAPPGPDFEPGEPAPEMEVEAGAIKGDFALTEMEQAAEDRQAELDMAPPAAETKTPEDIENDRVVMQALREQFPDATEEEILEAVEGVKATTKEDLGWVAPEEAEPTPSAVAPKPDQEGKAFEAEPEPVEAAPEAAPGWEPVDEISRDEVVQATEQVEPTGAAIDTAETIRTARPEFQGLIFSFKPGDPRGDETMPHYYGELAETEDADGMPIDVMWNNASDPTETGGPIYIVDQLRDGEFYQHKVLGGFEAEFDAEQAYAEVWGGDTIANISELTQEEFQDWVSSGNHKLPYAEPDTTPVVEPEPAVEPTQPEEVQGAGTVQPEETEQERKDRVQAERRQRATEQVEKTRQISETDDLITFAQKLGGINVDLEGDVRGRLKGLGSKAVGLPGIEQTGGSGLSLDQLAEAAWEAGYIQNYDSQELIDALFEAESRPIYTPAGQEAQAREQAEAEADQQALAEAQEWADFVNESEDIKEVDGETASLMKQAMELDPDATEALMEKDTTEAEFQAQLRELIDERKSAKTAEAAAPAEPQEAVQPDEVEQATAAATEEGLTPLEAYENLLREKIKGVRNWRKLIAATWQKELYANYLMGADPAGKWAELGWIAGYLYGRDRNLTMSAAPSEGERIAAELEIPQFQGFERAHYVGQQAWRNRDTLLEAPPPAEPTPEPTPDIKQEMAKHFRKIEKQMKKGRWNADLIPAIGNAPDIDAPASMTLYEEVMREAGWTPFIKGKGEYWENAKGDELFLRSQGGLSAPIVQYTAFEARSVFDVLSSAMYPDPTSKPLKEIKLSFTEGDETVTHTAEWWVEHVDERIQKAAELRGCA